MSVAISWANKMQLAKCDIMVGFPISSHIYISARNTFNCQNNCRDKFGWPETYYHKDSNLEILIISIACTCMVVFAKSSHIYNLKVYCNQSFSCTRPCIHKGIRHVLPGPGHIYFIVLYYWI